MLRKKKNKKKTKEQSRRKPKLPSIFRKLTRVPNFIEQRRVNPVELQSALSDDGQVAMDCRHAVEGVLHVVMRRGNSLQGSVDV